jgi:mannose-6-phosphate isomerase-like protein (cupin superfamily)
MKIRPFVGYEGVPPVPKPDVPPEPDVVTVQDGVPVQYPDCAGVGVRVVHPTNPKAYTETMGIVMFYLPPHASLAPGSHYTEETYCFLKGHGIMLLNGKPTEVGPGTFVHLPP